MFQLKDFASISAAQVNHARAVTTKITDFQPGSVARTLMEAPAVEIEELYIQMFLGLRDAIPVSTFLSFGFTNLPAKTARGYVSISLSAAPSVAFSIPLGTIFSTAAGVEYASTAAVTWPVTETIVRVPVACTVAGVVGNVAAGLIADSVAFDASYTISNSLIATGADLESDAEREARFAEYVASLSSATVVACLYAARASRVLDVDGNIFEYVTRSGLSEEPGIVRIYLYSSLGVPSAALLADGQLRLDGTRDDGAGTITPGVRGAGVRVDILPMTERAVPMGVQVEMLTGYTLTTAVQQAIGDAYGTAIRAIIPGQTLQIGLLVEQLLAVTGVKTIVTDAESNIVCGVNEALVPGTITVTAL